MSLSEKDFTPLTRSQTIVLLILSVVGSILSFVFLPLLFAIIVTLALIAAFFSTWYGLLPPM